MSELGAIVKVDVEVMRTSGNILGTTIGQGEDINWQTRQSRSLPQYYVHSYCFLLLFSFVFDSHLCYFMYIYLTFHIQSIQIEQKIQVVLPSQLPM